MIQPTQYQPPAPAPVPTHTHTPAPVPTHTHTPAPVHIPAPVPNSSVSVMFPGLQKQFQSPGQQFLPPSHGHGLSSSIMNLFNGLNFNPYQQNVSTNQVTGTPIKSQNFTTSCPNTAVAAPTPATNFPDTTNVVGVAEAADRN